MRFLRNHWIAVSTIGLIVFIIILIYQPIQDFIDAVMGVVDRGMYIVSRLSGEPLYDEDALYEWQNGGDDDYTDSLLEALKKAQAGDEEAMELLEPIIVDSHFFLAPEDISGVFQECSDYNKRMFEVFNVDYSYRKWAWDNWGSEETGDRYYICLTEPNELNAFHTGYYGTHGRSKYYPTDWINPSDESLGSDSEGCLSGWYWLMNPEQDNEDADGYPVYDISEYDGQLHEPDPWFGQEQRMDIEGEAKKDNEGNYIEGTHRYQIKWQDIMAMCQYVGLFNYDEWGTLDTSVYSPDVAFTEDETDDYYLSDEQINDIIGLFEYKFTYLYEPTTADSFVGRAYEELTVEFNFLKAEKGDYDFGYRFIKEEPESVLESAWSGGYEHYEWVTAYVPEAAPTTIANSWETLEYIYTSKRNVPNYLPEGDTYDPPNGDYCVGRFDIQDPTLFIETVSDMTHEYYYNKTTSDAEVESGYGDGDEGEWWVETMDYHWAPEMIQFYTEYLDMMPFADGHSDIYTELAKDYDKHIIRISYEGTQTDEYLEELVKLLGLYAEYTVVFPVAEGMSDDGEYPEGWTTDITQANMGTEEFFDIEYDLAGLPFHSYGVTYHGEESAGTDTPDAPSPIDDSPSWLEGEQEVLYETLLELLVANGYGYTKAMGMAYAFSILYPKYGLIVACGVMANINHEGSPAQMEGFDGDGTYIGSDGKVHHQDWYGTTKQQQSLAGKKLSTSDQLNLCETIPDSTAAGLGMCQWSFKRRIALLKQYKADGLFTKGTFSTTDAMISEVKYMLSELEGSENAALKATQKASTAYEAAMTFQKKFERPRTVSSTRGNTGKALYELITKWMEEGNSDTGI